MKLDFGGPGDVGGDRADGGDRLDVALASQHLLHRLVDYFEVDLSFLRRNDHDLGATMLVAEWPPRPEIPDPDPLGVIIFADADPTFAALETPVDGDDHPARRTDDEYQDRVRQGSGIQGGLAGDGSADDRDRTTGTLGFIKYGDREWRREEINALRAVAALLAQLQARVAAEERLRYLAYHDELTAAGHPPRLDRPPRANG